MKLLIRNYMSIFLILTLISCLQKDDDINAQSQSQLITKEYKTENVIILVIDGPRYSETWGEAAKKNIPHQASLLAKEGTLHTSFYNNGETYTNAGHTAITTGNYQTINNSGNELPAKSSIFQHFMAQKKLKNTDVWVIASKDKLDILANTNEINWQNNFMPSYDCGKIVEVLRKTPCLPFFPCNPIYKTAYREDAETYNKVEEVLIKHHPKLLLINFREPDYSAHSNNWPNYIKGIKDTDEYVKKLWDFIQSHPLYKDKTTLFVTNDHGRHAEGHLDGFVSHTDKSEECRHISLFTIGPDFKKNQVFNVSREQIDISATIAELLKFNFPSNGKIMTELFE